MGRLLALLVQIHRRLLWQTFIIYTVIASVTYRVSVEVALRRRLPGWFGDLALALLIIGLPVVMITAYVQRGIPALGRHQTRDLGRGEEFAAGNAPSGKERIRRIFTWKNAIIAGVAAFTLWAIVGVGWLYLASELVGDAPRPAAEDPRLNGHR